MATNLLSSVLGSANAAMGNAMDSASRKRSLVEQQKEELSREDRKVIYHMLENARSPEEVAIISDYAKKAGINPNVLDANLALHTRRTEEQKEKLANTGNTIRNFLSQLNGGQSAALQTPAAPGSILTPFLSSSTTTSTAAPPLQDAPAYQPPTSPTQTVDLSTTQTPTAKPSKKGSALAPRFGISNVNVDENGNITNWQLNVEKGVEGQEIGKWLVDNGYMDEQTASNAIANINQINLLSKAQRGRIDETLIQKSDVPGEAEFQLIHKMKDGTAFTVPLEGSPIVQETQKSEPVSWVMLPGATSPTPVTRDQLTSLPEGTIPYKVPSKDSIYGSLKPEEQQALDKVLSEGRFDPMRINGRNAQIIARAELASPGQDFNQMSEDVLQGRTEARQRGGVRAANLEAASKLYTQNMPRMVELREKVASKGLLPSGGLTTINAFNNWLQLKTSDPDMAELQGKVRLLADSLQRIFGAGQGGEWAFKVAESLLDPSLSPEAFQRRMESHGEDLRSMTKYYRSFGEGAAPQESPVPTNPTPNEIPITDEDRKAAEAFWRNRGQK